MVKILIAGGGFVGKKMFELFPQSLVYDKYKTVRDFTPYPDMQRRFFSEPLPETFDYCFICVPTPMKEDGSCDTSALEDVVSCIKAKLFIIRSAVPIGYSDILHEEYKVNVLYQPEYVASSTPYPAPFNSEASMPFLILGGLPKNIKKARRLYDKVYPPTIRILEVTAVEAELIKLCENTAIAAKVTLCNEYYELCKRFGADYDKVAEGVFQLDPRFTPFWTRIYKDKRGFSSSHCLPKDLNDLVSCAKSKGYEPGFLKAILESNERFNEKNNNKHSV